jgi:hypothetical protein
VENRYPILFEPFAIKHHHDDTYQYDITGYQQADEGVINFLKYLVNFSFYRYGLEVNKFDFKYLNKPNFVFRSVT